MVMMGGACTVKEALNGSTAGGGGDCGSDRSDEKV